MTTTATTTKVSATITVDAAAQAAIGAAARELHLPTVRAEAVRLADIAVRNRHTHLAYLAEVLAAEVDDRTARRRTRRINEAHFPRQKRLADFNIDAVPSIQPAQIGALANGGYMDAGEPIVLLGDFGTGKSHLLIGFGWPPANRGGGSSTSPPPSWSANWSRPPTIGNDPGSWPATAAWTCPASTRSATSRSTPAEPNCCSKIITEREERVHRDRHQPAVLRVGHRVSRPPPGRRHR